MATGRRTVRSPAAEQARWRERSRRQQSAIVRLATSPEVASGDRRAALRLATEVGAHALLIARCSVWFLEDEDRLLSCHDLYEPGPDRHAARTSLAAADYPSYFAALRSGRAIDAHDARSDPRTAEFREGYLEGLGIASMLDAAIRVGGRVLGVVCFEHVGEARAWQPDEISFAGEIADQIAHVIIGEQKRQADEERDSLWMQLTESERLRTIGTLAAGIAHDFNNILTPILAHAELAQLALDADDPAYAHLQPIVENATKARALVRQLLTVGRPQPSNSAAHCDLDEVADEVITLARASIPSSIAIRSERAGEAVAVALEASQLHQILLNLVVNAGHAIGSRGGEIVMRTGTEDDHARVEVQDDGIGMDEATRRRIFEPFFSTRSAGGGSGLGLAVVYGILESCGGRIEVESAPGRGSRFTIHLPRAAAAERSSVERAAAVELVDHHRILLVDDEAAVVEVVAAQLARGGHEVVRTVDPREALERFEREPDAFDLVLSDHSMPGMSGSELLRRLRALRPGLRTILMSGLDLDPAEHGEHVDTILMKPLRLGELDAAIRRLAPKP